MPHQHAQTPARRIVLSVALISLVSPLASVHVCAQTGRSRDPTHGRSKINAAAMRDITRDHMAKQLARQFERQRISLMPQIREDFARMQVVNNEMMRAVFVVDTLDYKQILDATAEIRKRAGRLKANLMLPAPEGSDETPEAPDASHQAALKESLLALDRSMMSFVTNPLFQQTGVLDAKLSTRASRDLRSIIELSRAIRKSVERLTKTSGLDVNLVEQRSGRQPRD